MLLNNRTKNVMGLKADYYIKRSTRNRYFSVRAVREGEEGGSISLVFRIIFFQA